MKRHPFFHSCIVNSISCLGSNLAYSERENKRSTDSFTFELEDKIIHAAVASKLKLFEMGLAPKPSGYKWSKSTKNYCEQYAVYL